MTNTFIKEIFSSVQGEGTYIGEKQLFIRFCKCNLNCNYCDTDFKKQDEIFIKELNKCYKNPLSAKDLAEIVKNFPPQTISLTGGEPLLETEFLKEFLLLINNKIYLETNGSLPEKLAEIIELVDVVAMDIKLKSATKQKKQFNKNREFLKIAKEFNKELFVKLVLWKDYDKEELKEVVKILKEEYEVPLILQPVNLSNSDEKFEGEELLELFNFLTSIYPKTRIIAQMHKFLNLE